VATTTEFASLLNSEPVNYFGTEAHEVVIKEGSELIGEALRDVDFPGRFNAAVTGVLRGGRPVEKELGSVVMRPGDTLLRSTGPGFRQAFEDSPHFLIVSEAEEEPEVPAAVAAEARFDPALSATATLAGVVGTMVTGLLPIPIAARFGALAVIALGCLSPGDARRSIDWSVLLVIGAALGLAQAMESTGAAALVGQGLVRLGQSLGALGILAAILTAAMLFTNLITNNAAVALMFPIALAAAQAEGLNPRPFLIAITVASSLAFVTPLGYQTNLMVYGPGGYRFTDFLRVGLPLQLLLAVLAVFLIPLVWPLGS